MTYLWVWLVFMKCAYLSQFSLLSLVESRSGRGNGGVSMETQRSLHLVHPRSWNFFQCNAPSQERGKSIVGWVHLHEKFHAEINERERRESWRNGTLSSFLGKEGLTIQHYFYYPNFHGVMLFTIYMVWHIAGNECNNKSSLLKGGERRKQ